MSLNCRIITLILGAFIVLASNQSYPETLKIVTVNSSEQAVLRKVTDDLQSHETNLSKEIGEKLFFTLKPHFPAAGLAAPQIGISKSIFIFSYDRNPENLETVINPTIKPVGNNTVSGWECCFSVMLGNIWKLAKIPRYETIDVTYFTIEGKKVEKRLEGFAAKAFQHEYDHLQGITVIDHKDAIIKEFNTKDELLNFLKVVKEEDAKHYKKPE